MKFRAIIQDQQFMREFLSIIVTLSKLSKDCIMNISFDKVYFIVNENAGNTAPLLWVEINSGIYFNKFLMNGANEKYPNILLSFNTSNFARALSVLRSSAKYCKIKLTNIQFPCLNIVMEVSSNLSEQTHHVVHDVPVSIIPIAEWDAYALPEVPKSKLTLNVPWNRTIRGIIDKMKNVSPSISFRITSNGEMKLVAETDLTTIKTSYTNLTVSDRENGLDSNDTAYIEASCLVNCKKTSIFFSSLQMPTFEMLFGIMDERLIYIKVGIRQGVAIHCILPAVTT